MIKSLRYLVVWACALLSLHLGAQTTVQLGYCPNDLNTVGDTIVFSDSYLTRIQAAIKFPAARMQVLKGSKITKLRFAAQAGMQNVYVFIRPALNKPAVSAVCKLKEAKEGWNEVTLSTPYTVTGEEIYLTFMGNILPGKGIFTSQEPHPYGAFIHDGKDWSDATDMGFGSLYLQADMEVGADVPEVDFALESLNFPSRFGHIGDTLQTEYVISNYGVKEAALPQVSLKNGNGATISWTPEGTLAPGKTMKLNHALVTKDFTEGYNDLQMWINTQDAFKSNDTLNLQYPCYHNAYPRKTLIEHFTTLPCTNCPYGLKVLTKLTEGRKDYVWVAHHVGYQSDELTVKDSYYLMDPLGIGGAPYAAFDRSVVSCSASKKASGFSIGYPSAEIGVQILQPGFDEAASTPAFISVNIDNQYDAATRQLTTTVSGERNKLLPLFYPDNFLTVELVEDGVETVGIQVGSKSKIHGHVFRQALTSVTGDSIKWNGDKYSVTYQVTLPANWNENKLRVVAFANRSIKNAKTDVQVLNANEKHVTLAGETGIEQATTTNNKVIARQYFNLQGQRIAQPAKGIYLEKVITTNGTQTFKRIR